MADSIKIGTQNVTFKVGSTSVSAICLGNTCVYRDTPTPTSYTYSVIITGLENGDTTNITWNYGDHIDYNVGNGTYTYSTSNNTADVIIDGVTNYTVDHDHFTLIDGGSQTVTFTYQGGGGGLVNIPQGTNMEQYYGQSITRLVINDTSVNLQTDITCQHFQDWMRQDSLTINPWYIVGQNAFNDIHSLPIDVTLSTPVELVSWGYNGGTYNGFNDLQIEWA